MNLGEARREAAKMRARGRLRESRPWAVALISWRDCGGVWTADDNRELRRVLREIMRDEVTSSLGPWSSRDPEYDGG